MVDARSRNPADLVKHYVDLIMTSRAKMEEALVEIAEYSEALHRVAVDTHQKLLTRD